MVIEWRTLFADEHLLIEEVIFIHWWFTESPWRFNSFFIPAKVFVFSNAWCFLSGFYNIIYLNFSIKHINLRFFSHIIEMCFVSCIFVWRWYILRLIHNCINKSPHFRIGNLKFLVLEIKSQFTVYFIFNSFIPVLLNFSCCWLNNILYSYRSKQLFILFLA